MEYLGGGSALDLVRMMTYRKYCIFIIFDITFSVQWSSGQSSLRLQFSLRAHHA